MCSPRSYVLLLTITMLSFVGASCAASVPPAPTPTAATSNTPRTAVTVAPSSTPKPEQSPKYGGTLTAESGNEAPHWDIQQVRTPYPIWFIGLAYNKLVDAAPTDANKILPDLAETWDISTDGKVYTFHLASGVTWHDGQPFSAEDARYSIGRMANPPEGTISGWKDAFGGLEKVEAPDNNTLKMTLAYPRPSLLPYLASAIYMMPKHVIEAKGSMKRDVIGTGPFRFKEYLPGSSVTLEKNPNYFKKGLPYLDRFVRYIIKDPATRFAAIKTGQIMVTAPYTSSLSTEQMEAIKKDFSDKIATGKLPQLSDFRVNFNLSRPPFNDIRLRQALALAIDGRKMINALSQGYGEIGGVLPAGSEWSFSKEEIEKMPGFRQPKDEDIAAAKKLLAEAGHPDGLKAGLLVRTASSHQAFAEVLKDQMKAIGVDLSIEVVDPTAWEDRVRRLAYDTAVRPYTQLLVDPDDAFSDYLCSNHDSAPTGFCDEQVDQLYQKQLRTLDKAERKAIALEIERKLLQEVPRAEGYRQPTFYAAWKKVMNYSPPLSTYHNPRFESVWLNQ